MDERITFTDNQLLSILLDIYQQEEKAAFMIDDHGLMNVEGIITNVEQNNDPAKSRIIINTGREILLENIMGVNGNFRTDFTTC